MVSQEKTTTKKSYHILSYVTSGFRAPLLVETRHRRKGKDSPAQNSFSFPAFLTYQPPKVENGGRMCAFRSNLRTLEFILCHISTVLLRTKIGVPVGARKCGLCDFSDSAYELNALIFSLSAKNKSRLR